MNNKTDKIVKKHSFRDFIKFYSRFPIPWWLYIGSMLCGLGGTALAVHMNKYTVAFNQGELYNSVLLGYAIWSFVAAALSIGLVMFAEYGDQKLILRARKTVWKHILHLPFNTFEKEDPLGMVSSITNEIPEAAVLINTLSGIVSSMYGLIAAIIVLVRFNATMLTYMLVLIPLAIIEFWVNGKLEYIMMRVKYKALNEMTAYFAEHLKCSKQIKAQALEEKEVKAGVDIINRQFKADVIYGLLLCAQVLVNAIYKNAYTIFIAVFGSRMIRQGTMNQDGILVFQTYWITQDQYLTEMLTKYQQVRGTQGAMEKVNRIMGYEEEDLHEAIAAPAEDGKGNAGDIVLENVHFSYDGDREALSDISCTIPYGKNVAVIGSNGCGKSTMFKLLMKLYEPNEGRIYICGNNEADDLTSWRKRIGYVGQSTALFTGTIRDNLLYGTDAVPEEGKLREIIDKINLGEVIYEKELGLEEQVGESGSRLSGGQRQRVAIARALATDPEYILMDEATSQLDVLNDKIVEKGTRELMNGKSVIFIAHNIAAARKADIIMLLDKGKLVDMGSDSELMERCGLYREFVSIEEGGGNYEDQ